MFTHEDRQLSASFVAPPSSVVSLFIANSTNFALMRTSNMKAGITTVA